MKRFACVFSFLALLAASANAMVVTGVTVNGIRLVSDLEYATAIPIKILIGNTGGSPILFNFTLASDATQNPNEFTMGDSMSVAFQADPSSGLGAPANFTSMTFYDGAKPQIPASISFSRDLGGAGTFNGSLSFHMSNSSSDYFSFFTGYEINPSFSFSIINSLPLPPTGPSSPVDPNPPSASAAPPVGIPEPCTLGLTLAGGLAVFAKARKRSA